MTVIIEGKDLERLVDWKLYELEEAFDDKFGEAFEDYITDIDIEECTDENGETYYLIQISDLSVSFTTIRCHKLGYNIHWGSSTPVFIKSIIEEVMGGE